MIGSCENCDRQNVPVSHGQISGMETTQCFICQGETDPDPYNEMDKRCSPMSEKPFIKDQAHRERIEKGEAPGDVAEIVREIESAASLGSDSMVRKDIALRRALGLIARFSAETARLETECNRWAETRSDNELRRSAIAAEARLAEIAAFNITPDTGYSVAQAMRRLASGAVG